MNYASNCFEYEPQILEADPEVWDELSEIAALLSGDFSDELLAYSIFYKILRKILPGMTESAISTDKTLQKAISYIINNWDKPFSVKDLALHCCVSESGVYHLFKKNIGTTPIKYYNHIRLEQAISAFASDDSIEQSAYRNGFESYGYFRELFKAYTGMAPRQYRMQKYGKS
jgi:AraC-like DNA-binding protein